jgi:hypothetical protein
MPDTSFYGVAHFGGGEIQRWVAATTHKGHNPDAVLNPYPKPK